MIRIVQRKTKRERQSHILKAQDEILRQTGSNKNNDEVKKYYQNKFSSNRQNDNYTNNKNTRSLK